MSCSIKNIVTLLVLVILSASCKNTWSGEDKAAFYEACTEDANKWAGSPERAKTYCDCVFEKMVLKYPNEEDALGHINDLIKDTSLQKCKLEIMGK